jgi:ribosomal protein S17E
VVIAAMGFAVWRLSKALLESYDARITREREHARELMQTIETVRSLTRGGGE